MNPFIPLDRYNITQWILMAKGSEVADHIVDAIGVSAAKMFFTYYGGMQVHIPDGSGRPGLFVERLIDLLGEPAYKSLIARFGGERITVPKGHAAALIARNRRIVADYSAGTPMLELVQRYDLSERQIRSILNRPTD